MPSQAPFNRTLTIVCGLQGVGKTKVAGVLAKRQGAELIRTDEIRDEVIQEFHYTEEGIFTEEDMQRVYRRMLHEAIKWLHQDRRVVLDATFARRKNRDRARRIALAMEADFQLIEVMCQEDIVKERIGSRSGDESAAGFAQHLVYKKKFEPITTEERPHIVIDNSGTFDELEMQLSAYFG